MPRFGWYGDDFTGATDTLACLADAGLRALLFTRVPSPAHLAAAGPLDAVGLAGATRAMTPEAMAAELAPAGRFFAALKVPVLHYKCCSTFDSAPEIGSIGAAVAALRPFFQNPLLPIFGGQPNIGRHCLFSTLFASAGIGGETHRIDRHPTMSRHPVTPMGEADLRLHLRAQGLADIAAIHFPNYDFGPAHVGDLLKRAAEARAPAVLLDVARASDLALLGPAIWSHAALAPLLAVGPSSVAQSLASAWPRTRPRPPEPLARATGPVFVMVGSLSPVSRAQADAARSYAHLEAAAGDIVEDGLAARDMFDRVATLLRSGRSVVLRTTPPAAAPIPPEMSAAIARRGAAFVARLLRAVPLKRVGIAGGDTSSHVALALDIWGLAHARSLAPGVALCLLRGDDDDLDGVEMMFKGGQMGPLDLFERFLHGDDAACRT